MDRRGRLETGGVALACGLVTAGLLRASVGHVDWPVVAGVLLGAALAAAANYRGRTGHGEGVAETAPRVPDAAPQAPDASGPGNAEDEPIDGDGERRRDGADGELRPKAGKR